MNQIHEHTRVLLPVVAEQLQGWDRIIAAADSGEEHLDVLLDVLTEYYKNTERHSTTQVSAPLRWVGCFIRGGSRATEDSLLARSPTTSVGVPSGSPLYRTYHVDGARARAWGG